MADLKPWDAILKIEETHNLFLELVKYALRECGGFLWPILYGFLYWYATSSLSTIGQIIFFALGVPLIVISVLYTSVWKKNNGKREKEWESFKNKQKNDFLNIHHLFEQFIDYTTRKGWWLPTQLNNAQTDLGRIYKKLDSSIEKFLRDYFPENNKPDSTG